MSNSKNNFEKQNSSNLTPLMKQYWDVKTAHSDKILFFRMGDFFEMFFDDAVTAAPLLGIALTSRNKKSQDETPMCGFPHHSIAGAVNKLLSHGYKVALCDQIEDPKMAKGLVKRAVTRILTPGMVYDCETLDESLSHYMACSVGNTLSFVDASTGEAFYYEGEHFKPHQKMFYELLNLLPVAELIIDQEGFTLIDKAKLNFTITLSNEDCGLNDCDQIKTQFGILPPSAACLLKYIHSLGGDEALKVIRNFEERKSHQRLEVSLTTLRHLEVFETYKGESRGSLFKSIQRTKTSAGSRALRQWLAFPLTDHKEIDSRLNLVTHWKEDLAHLKRVREILGTIGDIERRFSKLSTPQCNARDLISLAQSAKSSLVALEMAESLIQKNTISQSDLNLELAEILKTFREDAPISTKQGHMVLQGISNELDELILLSQDSQSLLAKMEAAEKEKTGISSLKIRYNNVFGYYIEVTNTHKDKVPTSYQRKQTLSNAERFCTEELIELEKKILTAQSKRNDLEYAIFETHRKYIVSQATQYLTVARQIAELDVITSLAWLSVEQNYTRPHFIAHGADLFLDLKGSRHPVIEQELKLPFIANNILLKKEQCMLLTGPNMAGKSTLMRQVAITAMMAQMGSYVPAEKATLPIYDQIFTRIGASDQLNEGLSTFMVEMKETAEILSRATPQSLVIMDEVGRGTSTFDGLSLAQSILEHLLQKIKSHAFFATHFHELTELDEYFPHLLNFHMTVSETDGEVRFLHTLSRGPALKSYGIYVGELAGLPNSVTKRAKVLLKKIQTEKVELSPQKSLFDYQEEVQSQLQAEEYEKQIQTLKEKIKNLELQNELLNTNFQNSNFNTTNSEVLSAIKELNVMAMSPLEALTRLAQLRDSLN